MSMSDDCKCGGYGCNECVDDGGMPVRQRENIVDAFKLAPLIAERDAAIARAESAEGVVAGLGRYIDDLRSQLATAKDNAEINLLGICQAQTESANDSELREFAEADNAALVAALRKWRALRHSTSTFEISESEQELLATLRAPHPGDALLEVVRFAFKEAFVTEGAIRIVEALRPFAGKP